MMKSKKLLLSSMIFFALYSVANAKSPTNTWDSDVVENYLSPKKGSTLNADALTNLEDKSRWYSTYRVKGGYKNEDKTHTEMLQLNARLRGKTYVTDNIGIIGDFWFRAQENYARKDGKTINDFDDLDERTTWEQYRFGFEHDDFGALMYGKHTATWSFFTVDMGSQGLLDTQGDAGVKNAGKFLYKKQFDNNLFLAGSYDRTSKIYGIDIGYQEVDLYNFKPGAFGVYASLHNGQPSITVGSKSIVGNVNHQKTLAGKTKNADSIFARDDESMFTYSVAGFKNFGSEYRLVGQAAYSERDKSESKDVIKARGWAKGGLGTSASMGIQKFPQTPSGFSYILYNTWDEFSGSSVTPQLEYWFGSPSLRAWISYTWEDHADDITRIEFQWDF